MIPHKSNHLLRLVMEPRHCVFRRWFNTPINIWEYDWMPNDPAKQPFVLAVCICFSSIMISHNQENKSQCLLVGGFKPFEKSSSNWIISPGRDEHKNLRNHHLLGWYKVIVFWYEDRVVEKPSKLSPVFLEALDCCSIKTHLYLERLQGASWRWCETIQFT